MIMILLQICLCADVEIALIAIILLVMIVMVIVMVLVMIVMVLVMIVMVLVMIVMMLVLMSNDGDFHVAATVPESRGVVTITEWTLTKSMAALSLNHLIHDTYC